MRINGGAIQVPESKVGVDGYEDRRPDYSEWHTWYPCNKDEGLCECDDLAEARAHWKSRASTRV